MDLVRLLYVSRLAANCGPSEFEDILAVSRENNRRDGISGALCCSGNGFLQCLEGPSDAVNYRYRAIARDDRHVDVTLLDYVGIRRRDFGDWSMAYIKNDDIDQEILQRVRRAENFDPFDLLPGEALDFLRLVTYARAGALDHQQSCNQ